MKLSQADGSVPRAADVNSLVTMTITTLVTHNEPILEKVDLSVPQSGIIPFTLTLSERNSSSVTLSVRLACFIIYFCVFSFLSSLLRCCWLGIRKSICLVEGDATAVPMATLRDTWLYRKCSQKMSR